MIAFLNLTSSFAFADNEFIQTEPADIYNPDSNMSLLENEELETNFNEEYYNEDHLVEYEKETDESFDSKAELHTIEEPDSSNSDPNTENSTFESLDIDSNSASSQSNSNTNRIQSYSLRSFAVSQSDDIVYDYYKSWNFGLGINEALPLDNPQFIINDFLGAEVGGTYDCTYSAYQHLIDYSKNDDYPSYNDLLNADFLTVDNCIIFKYSIRRYFGYATNYGFLFTDNGRFDMVSCDNSLGSTNLIPDASQKYTIKNLLFSSTYGKFTPKDGINPTYCYLNVCFVINGVGKSFTPTVLNDFSIETNFTPVYIGSNIDLYIDDVKQDKINEDGFIDGDIKGEFKLNEKSHILSYKAWSDKELDKTYDVHLWALDSSDVPTKINGSASFPIVDLDTSTENNLQLSADKTSGQASIDLEAIYYYVHQMKGFDDSLESVDGYNFAEFESRENLNFAIAYREHGSSGDWIVCKSYQYNYGDLINNVMGSFTVKKDYVDFPSIDDYIEQMPDFDDFLSEIGGDDPSIFDYIKAGFKYIGNCIGVLCHNFVGFFKWLWDCIPILWENLTIALYNLVCDLKSLALYLFNPKTKSIYAMACERIPSLMVLSNSIQNPNSVSVPSLTFFGFKLSLNFSDYFDVSYAKSIFSLLYVLIFAFGVFKLLMRVFSFDSGGDDN